MSILLLPDMLSYDPRRPASFPTNGRTLTDDAADAFLAVLTNGKVQAPSKMRKPSGSRRNAAQIGGHGTNVILAQKAEAVVDDLGHADLSQLPRLVIAYLR
jgi:hypothetical protein